MHYKDITTDTETTYTLSSQEKTVYYMLNRSGNISFELSGEGAEAHIFAFFIGKGADSSKLNIIQKHSAPRTTSSALVKSILMDDSEFTYEGLIRITKDGNQADASQESRSLLLSENATAFTKPALEILADDVKCRHAATVSPISEEALFFAKSRGLSENQATELLLTGFMNDAMNAMKKHGVPIETFEKKILHSLKAT